MRLLAALVSITRGPNRIVEALLLCILVVLPVASPARAQGREPLPSPLGLEDVLEYSLKHRQEIVAGRARARAAGERAPIVSALDDPMIMPSVEHLPFMFHGLDGSLMVEQRFPLSGILGDRRRAAEAEARRFRAEATRIAQAVLFDAARAFLMLRERREMERVLHEQLALAGQFIAAANARYGAGLGNQPEVLRAEIEFARFQATISVVKSEISAAEAMLNTSLGRDADSTIPPIEHTPLTEEPALWAEVRNRTLVGRPELQAGRAEIARAQAEAAVMESMYWPMGLVRTGPSYTMADGWGWMAIVGVSVPLWRGRLDAGAREAQAMTEMAQADLLAMTRMAEGEAATARHQVLAARQRVLSLRSDILPRTRQAIEPSLAAYAAGVMPLVSVIDTAQALWSTQAELVSAEFELGLAWVRLYWAQGQFEERWHQ